MKGIMLKDLYTYKNYSRSLLMMVGIYVVLSLFISVASVISTVVVLLASSYSVGLFSYDEHAHFDRFACTLPVSRRRVVLARYLLNLVLLVGMAVASYAFSLTLTLLTGGTASAIELLLSTCIAFVMGMVMMSFLYPISYKFGSEKARIFLGAAFALLFAGIMLLVRFLPGVFDSLETSSPAALAAGGGLLCLVLYGVSYLMSARIYTKKEF